LNVESVKGLGAKVEQFFKMRLPPFIEFGIFVDSDCPDISQIDFFSWLMIFLFWAMVGVDAVGNDQTILRGGRH